MEKRLLGADFLRAIACLMVLVHHLIVRIDSGPRPDWLQALFDFLVMGSYGVSVFFVLSGYLLSRPFWVALDAGQPMPSLRTFALRRAARILPGFWLALTATLVLGLIFLDVEPSALLFLRYLAGFFLVSDWHYASLFPVENNGPLWSIGFEVTSYLLLPFCLALLFWWRPRNAWVARGAWIGVICLFVGLHALIVLYLPIDNVRRGFQYGLVGGGKAWMPRYNPIGFFGIFAIGALAAAVQVRWRQFSSWLFDALAVAGLALSAWMIHANAGGATDGYALLGIPYGYPLFPLGIALTLAAAPSSRLVGALMDNRVARFVAQISFGIYVWHYLVIEFIIQKVLANYPHEQIANMQTWLIVAAATAGIAFTLAWLSFRFLESPVIRWARGLEKPSMSRKPNVEPVESLGSKSQ
jgi:peptidoglycan/LPS O-acetylase OafA/YrhL